eukprot:95441-Prymnesium_polylepis.1
MSGTQPAMSASYCRIPKPVPCGARQNLERRIAAASSSLPFGSGLPYRPKQNSRRGGVVRRPICATRVCRRGAG